VGDMQAFLYVFALSLLPTVEGRYAVLAGRLLGLNWAETLTAAIGGVILLGVTLPWLLPLVDLVAHRMAESQHGILSRAARAYLGYVESLRRRSRRYVESYGLLGLTLFVALPLPGTGEWSGALAAYLLGIDRRLSMLALMLGGLASISITLPLSYGTPPWR